MRRRRRGWGRDAEHDTRIVKKWRHGAPALRYRVTLVTKKGERLQGTMQTRQPCEVGEIVMPLPDDQDSYLGPTLGRVVERMDAEAPYAAHIVMEAYAITNPRRPFEPIEWCEPDRD